MSSQKERAVCERVVLDLEIDEPVYTSKFEYDQRMVDLDRDKKPEVVIWLRSIGGTSGFPLLIYQTDRTGFRLLYKGLAWSPIISVPSISDGWKSVAFSRQGGGVDSHFVTLRYSSTRYHEESTSLTEPHGELIFSKDWETSFYGPNRP